MASKKNLPSPDAVDGEEPKSASEHGNRRGLKSRRGQDKGRRGKKGVEAQDRVHDPEKALAEVRTSLEQDELRRQQNPGIFRRIGNWWDAFMERRRAAARARVLARMAAPGKAEASRRAEATTAKQPAATADPEASETAGAAAASRAGAPAETEVVEPPGESPDLDAEGTPPPSRSTLTDEVRSRPFDEREVAIRSVALEGYEEQPAAETPLKLTLDQRIRILMLELNRRERRVLVGVFAGIAVAAVLIGAYFTVTTASLVFTRPTPGKELVIGPEPSRVELPGGWAFVLARGRVERSQWDPKVAEWLEGTDVCRWVALPWSLQLEAVVRTLKPNDPITLTMSNTDQLVYRVKSIHEVGAREIGTLDQNTPCLLVVLANSNSSKRWVVTAVP